MRAVRSAGLAQGNIITKTRHASACFARHRLACHERREPHRIGARSGSRSVALRLVGAVSTGPLRPALRLVDLTVSYDRHPAVHHLSAEIPAGEMTAIIGPNGA